MDRIINNLQGVENNFLRCRDLLLPTRRPKRSNYPIICECVNTEDQIRRPHIKLIRRFGSTHYLKDANFVPQHLHHRTPPCTLKTKTISNQESDSLNNLREIDWSCLKWLDAQPPESVIYVSFGSLTVIGNHELMEFWQGLVNSGSNFLWVIRPDLVKGKNGEHEYEIPAELEEGTRKRGYMVGWAPQEKVLSHAAVGGFLTHSGWNSTLESMVVGKPMICWPYAMDQQVNSRFVSHVWRVGLDMKDVCDREVVAKMVNDLMVNKREEFVRSAAEIANSIRRSVSAGGSSYADFDCLVHDIRLLSQRKIVES